VRAAISVVLSATLAIEPDGLVARLYRGRG
jgi:hypothetical protein